MRWIGVVAGWLLSLAAWVALATQPVRIAIGFWRIGYWPTATELISAIMLCLIALGFIYAGRLVAVKFWACTNSLIAGCARMSFRYLPPATVIASRAGFYDASLEVFSP